MSPQLGQFPPQRRYLHVPGADRLRDHLERVLGRVHVVPQQGHGRAEQGNIRGAHLAKVERRIVTRKHSHLTGTAESGEHHTAEDCRRGKQQDHDHNRNRAMLGGWQCTHSGGERTPARSGPSCSRSPQTLTPRDAQGWAPLAALT